jgi:hypothetical protein
MWQDPIVEEIHAIRVAIEEECQGDFAKLSALAYEIEQQYPDRVVSKPAAWENQSKPSVPLENHKHNG